MTDIASRQARYVVRLYSPDTGALIAIIDDLRFINIERYVNSYDIVTIGMDGNDPRTALFTLDAIIEVWRHIDRPDTDWYRESVALHRSPQRELTENQLHIFTSYSRGLLDLIRRRIIAYYANTAQTLKSGPGETVIKQFVDENAGPGAGGATTRLAIGTTLGLEIEANAGLGTLWSGVRSWQSLLEVIQEVASLTSVDFDIERVGSSGRSFLFKTFYPQLGTDRRTSLVFSPTIGNMVAPSYTLSRTEEVTTVIVLGQGQENARAVVVRTSAAAAVSPWNNIEASIDARNQNTIGGLQTAGDLQLLKSQTQESFTFNVLQISSVQYGADYFLGDIVTAGFEDVTSVRKITAIKIGVSEGRETITAEFSVYPPVLT